MSVENLFFQQNKNLDADDVPNEFWNLKKILCQCRRYILLQCFQITNFLYVQHYQHLNLDLNIKIILHWMDVSYFQFALFGNYM